MKRRHFRSNTRPLMVLLILLILPLKAFSATLHVGPGAYGTIQAAIDAAQDDDDIIIADGTYTGEGNRNLDLKGKAVRIQSENGPDGCVIDVAGTGRGFVLHSNESNAARIIGLTVCNATSGGIVCNSSSPTIANCVLTNNRNESGNGGGVSCINSFARIVGCRVEGNVARYGGGISCEDSPVVISGCTISGNAVGFGRGGGIYCLRSDASISDCLISSNEVVLGLGVAYVDVLRNGGGGMYLEESSPDITGCRIRDNLSVGIWIPFPFPLSFICNGGGAFLNNADPVLTNCMITGNQAVFSRGGGLYCVDSSPELLNCTLSDNVASILGLNPGGGVYSLDSSITATNCIFWQDAVDEIDYSGDTPAVSYSDIQAGYPGAGNISESPNFVDAADGDYRLAHSSPCIDSGTDGMPGIPVVDIDGDPRPVDGNCDGTVAVDMGADEYYKFCACDLNRDCRCDMRDWLLFGQDWGRTDCLNPGVTCECDLNHDGRCDMGDWLLFGQNWGSTDCASATGGMIE